MTAIEFLNAPDTKETPSPAEAFLESEAPFSEPRFKIGQSEQFKINPLSTGSFQPSQFSSGVPPSVPPSENPDFALTKAAANDPIGFAKSLPESAMKLVGDTAAEALNLPARGYRALSPEARAVAKPILRALTSKKYEEESNPQKAFGAPEGDKPLPFQQGQSSVQLSQNPDNALAKFIEGFSTPEMIATFPFAAAKPVQALFLAQTAPAAVEAASKLVSKDTPANERGAAATDLLLNGLFSYGLARGLIKGKPTAETPVEVPATAPIAPEDAANQVGGLKFDGVHKANSGNWWSFTVTEKGLETSFIVPEGSSPEVVAAKKQKILAPFLEFQAKNKTAEPPSTETAKTPAVTGNENQPVAAGGVKPVEAQSLSEKLPTISDKNIVAQTEPVQRVDIDNGTRFTQYRVRKTTDAEASARWETYGHKRWVVERRTIRTNAGQIEHGDHEEWSPFATGESKKSAIEDGIGDTYFQNAPSTDAVHKAVADDVKSRNSWKADKEKRMKDAYNEARFAEDNVLRIKDDANKKYQTALKRAKLFDAAQKGEADPTAIKSIQEKLQATWMPEYEKAQKKLREKLLSVKSIEDEKYEKPFAKTVEALPAGDAASPERHLGDVLPKTEEVKPTSPQEPVAGSEPVVESVTPLDENLNPIQKYRVGNSPQLHSIVEKLPQSEVEKTNGEQSYRVKNDRTGEEQVVTDKDLTPVTQKPLADKAVQKSKVEDLDKQLRAAKLDPSAFSNVGQKRAALKRARAISEFPKKQLSRAPGAAAEGEPGTYSAIQQLADQLEVTGKENAPVNEKVSAIERAKVKGSEIKDSVKAGLANILAIKKAMWDSYANLSPYTDMKRIVGKWFYAGQKADFEAREFGKQIVKAIPDKVRREAITNWIQADGDVGLLKERSDASKPQFKRGYEIAQKLTPREIEIAQMLREYYDRQLEKGINEGLLKEGLENYITQVWKKENPITKKLMSELVNSKLQPNFKYARKRIFESYFEGEQAGYTPSKDAGFLVSNYDQSFNKSLAARAFIKDLHEGTASDGRPLVEVSGSGKLVDANEPKPRFIIKPKTTPEATGDYRTIDHPALRGWKWIGKTPEGADVLIQGELKVHPEIYNKLKNRLSTSWFRQNPIARGVLSVQSTLKQSMMSISGFHQVQENLHALGHKVNPFNLEKLDFSEPVTKSLVEHGLQLADYNALDQFGEGLSSGNLVAKVPLIGSKLKQYNDWLFQDNIPRLKLTMAKHALERNKERYAKEIESGKITPDQVLELTASQANHAFGELPYKYWGRNPNLQDFYRTFLLAPDFLEARAGFVGQALKPGGLGAKGLLKNEQLQALALLALTQYITARIANQIIDKDPHWELKNAFRIISGNHAYSLRTVPGDIVHLISDPRGFTYNRLSPVVGRGSIELATGRDYRGVKRDFFDQMKDLLKSGIPISFNHKNGQTILETFGNAFGVQNQRYDAVQNIQQKVQDFKSENNIKDSYETIYNPDEDKFAALRAAIYTGNQKSSQAEYDKLKLTVPPAKIREHFKLSLTHPFTGSAANDKKFYNSLNEVGKMEYKEAQDLRKARLNAVLSLK